MEEIGYILSKLDIAGGNMMIGLARKYGMVYLDAFMTAQTIAEEAAVLNEMMKMKSVDKRDGE